MIVDYASVFASLAQALAIDGAGAGGVTPVRDKAQLVETLRHAIDEAAVFCANHGILLPDGEEPAMGGLDRLQRLDTAVEAVISPDGLRRDFRSHGRTVSLLHRAIMPDPAALAFAARATSLATIAGTIRAKRDPGRASIAQVMGEINAVLDQSIAGTAIREQGPPPLNLSTIDFQALARRFATAKHKNIELETLKAAIRAQLDHMVQLNRTRADFVEKFEALIESYNNGSRSIDELFRELLELSKSLSEEQDRHIREHLTEEELVIFDILTRPAPPLSGEEREELKKVTRSLLQRLKGLLVLNWRQKAAARSSVKIAIEDVLDSGLPSVYSPALYHQTCAEVFEHIYDSYPERDQGIYATV